MKKKILSVLLSLCLLVGTFPAVAQAQTTGDDAAPTEFTLTQADQAVLGLQHGLWTLETQEVDKSVLEMAIAKAEYMLADEYKYVPQFLGQLRTALKSAYVVYYDATATDAAVQAASDALVEAILVQRFKADKSILEDLVAKAEKIDVTGYTPESVAAFYAALEHARELLADETLSEEDQRLVDQAVARLADAIDGLTAMPEEANKTLLEKTVTYALGLSTVGVVEAAKQKFQDALDHAQAVLNDPYASQAEVDAAWDALLEGIWGLGLIQGDKTELGQLMDQAQQMVDNQDKYVTEHWGLLVDALAAAQAIMDDPNAMEEDITPVAEALLEAILAQRFKADKSILEDLIAQAEQMDVSKYTDESAAVFQEALDHAKDVMADETLSEEDQAVVDQAVKELSDAMAALVRKVLVEDSTGDISVGDAQDSFIPGTVVSVEHITEGDIYDRVEEALDGLPIVMDSVVIYEFNATLDGEAVQPQEMVAVTFQIPQGMNPDYLKLYYVSDTGEVEEIPITVDKETNTATAYLTHFSTYVLAEVSSNDTADKAKLQQLMEKATDLVEQQEQYVATHWDALLTALDAAQSVYEDPAATEQEVEEAAQALLQAILVQRFKADKSILEDVIHRALAVDLTGCTQQQVEIFQAALDQAQAVLADDTLSTADQAVVDAAVAAPFAALGDATADTQPEASDKPEASKDPEATQQPESVPPTGDHAPLMAYLGILTLSAAALLILAQNKRKA